MWGGGSVVLVLLGHKSFSYAIPWNDVFIPMVDTDSLLTHHVPTSEKGNDAEIPELEHLTLLLFHWPLLGSWPCLAARESGKSSV